MRKSLLKATFWKIALAVVVALLGKASVALADGIVLISSGGGVYDYGVEVTSPILTFTNNQTVTISGLSGVKGASADSVLQGGFLLASFTSSSVTFIQSLFGAEVFPITGTFGDLIVDSTVLTLGTVDWSAQTSNGTLIGTVQGPVAAPEPSSVGLMLLGIGLVFMVRKHTGAGLSRAS